VAERLELQRLETLKAQRKAVREFQEMQSATCAPPPFDYALDGPETVASLRRFAGEDVGINERKAAQAQQQARWCDNMIAACEAQVTKQRSEAQAEHESLMAAVALGSALTLHQEARKAQLTASVAEANRDLAALKRERDERDAAERAAMGMQALIVDEGPGDGLPSYDFRGFTPEQLQAVSDEQGRQRAELASQRAAEAAEARHDALQATLVKKMADKLAVDAVLFQQLQRKAVADALARQKADTERALELEEVNAKRPNVTEEFQSRFGHHAR
jgi:hypothetical protein